MYETIKQLAKSNKLSVTDLIALAPQNDPFYMGTKTEVDRAQWFADLWHSAGYINGVHLRRVHYFAVSKGITDHKGDPYENTDRCWGYLVLASKNARYLGLVPIEAVHDAKNPNPNQNAYYEHKDNPSFDIYTPSLEDPYISVYGFEINNTQPYHLEVWCEKSTMNDVLNPVCQKFGANLVTFEGETSITACYELMKRIDDSGGKPTRIFYISDFDPAGKSIPVAMARKVEYMVQYYKQDTDVGKNFEVKVKSLVLTQDQVSTYRLPRTPIKKTEKRAGKFQKSFGTGAVELDALEALQPGQLSEIVTEAMKPYYSYEAEQEMMEAERNLRQAVKKQIDSITSKYTDEIEVVQNMLSEINAITEDVSDYLPEYIKPQQKIVYYTCRLINTDKD